MAIIQISKIQQRSGNLVDLPQLSEAQLGWANDAKRLFIGGTGNANTYNENIEVLTSYSDITFSQINGSEGNLNISNAQTGQILTYVASTNTWDNAGGNALQPGNDGLYTNVNIHLGDITTLKIGGGAIGYVLETDGVGNLAWTPKGTLYIPIEALSNATPIIMTVSENTPYTNGLGVTISGATGANANTIVNGQTFYVKLAVDFPTTGNVALYTDSGLSIGAVGTNLGTSTPNVAIATSSVGGSGGGSGAAGGSNTTIQFNDNNLVQGNAGFTFNKITGAMAIPGNVTSINATLGNLVTSNYFAGTLTTNAQTNITSVGTLISLTVTANTTSGNLNTAGTVTASRLISNIATGTAPFTVTSTTQVANLNVATAGLATFATTANAVAGANVSGAVAFATTANAVAGANVSGAVTFATTANAVAGANVFGQVANALVAGTVYTAAQPNITSTGTLTGVSVSGNVTTTGIKTDNYYYANGTPISFAGAYSNSNVASYLPTFTGTIGATGLTTGSPSISGTITGNWGLSVGSKLSATYADLAEYYESDKPYEPGTVVEFGGSKEVTIAEDCTTRVAGVISTDPAYVMNSQCKGNYIVALALQGRVPCKIRGKVRKGDMLVSAGEGYARPMIHPYIGSVIGKSLENFDGIEGIIEVAVGRL